jgi:hypothetical protein
LLLLLLHFSNSCQVFASLCKIQEIYTLAQRAREGRHDLPRLQYPARLQVKI